MNDKPNIKPNYIAPLKRFCMTIGQLPTSYLETMSYYEMLVWFVEFLKNRVIPAIDNNAEALQELQSLFNELEDYVNNYFDNLDIQTEIDNKIDELIATGQFEDILSAITNMRSYATTTELIADTTITAGTLAITSGYSTANDAKGGLFIIKSSSDKRGFTLNNGLFAEIIENDGIKRNENSTSNNFKVYSNKLSGVTKSSMYPINQEEDKDSCVEVKYNECLIENINITNTNNYSNKTAIDVQTPSQRNKFDSIYIDSNFETGIKLPQSYYSEFIDVWVKGNRGIIIGNESAPANWIGVLDFNACHFNGSNLAVKEVATDTNTICFDKCSFENNAKCVDNSGLLYFKNTYFGDTKTTTLDVGILDANDGSETHFEDCTLGMVAQSYESSATKISLFNLKGNTNGSKVFVNGGKIHISNNNVAASQSSIYDSNSNLNEIYLDNVSFVPSTVNNNHNQFPYILLNGYSPLRSLNPIKNYVVNGTFKNPIMNDAIISQDSSHATYDENLVNPFGGKVLTFTRTAAAQGGYARFYYKIPKSLVGKQMVLEIYGWCNNGYLAVQSENLGVPIYYYNFSLNNTNRNKPRMIRAVVTPTAEEGLISTFIHWNDPADDTSYLIAGMILKEYKYKNFLSCYDDQDIMISKALPSNTTDAKKGDIVYSSFDSSNNALGWIYNGSNWVSYNSYS